MKTLVFDAAPKHVLVVEGQQVHGGEELRVRDELAARLLASPYTPVSIRDLTSLHRDELNRLAEQAGIDHPDDLPNKDAVIEALHTQPEAEPGEGQSLEGEE